MTPDRSAPLRFSAPDDGEELARAEVYGLLARLFLAPPDAELHAAFQVAVTAAPVPGGFLERSWGDLVAAARRLDRDAIEDEFDALFGGVGKPDILPYASFFASGRLNDKPLVALRRSLASLGLEGTGERGVSEDHVASVCEVMRWLIAGEDDGPGGLDAERRFFEAHLAPLAGPLCDAVEQHARADFYRAAARFARDFFAVETQGFDLLDT